MARSTYRLSELAEMVGGNSYGDADTEISGINSLMAAQPGQISYFEGNKQRSYLAETAASAVVLKERDLKYWENSALIVQDPRLCFAKLIRVFYHDQPSKNGVHSTAVIGQDVLIDSTANIGPYAVIGDGVEIGPNTMIGPHTTIGDHVTIGQQCKIYGQVSIYPSCKIGDRSIIHSGAVIGADGFGFVPDEQKHWYKIPQIGRVLIGNDVEIGANTTIDRGALEDTVIGDGVKLDDLVMIGHNVQVGDHTIMAGCAGVAGSTKIGSFCMIGGGACITDHITITDQVVITGMGAVHISIDQPGIYGSGLGIAPRGKWSRNVARIMRLEKTEARISELEKKIYELDEH